MGFSSDQPSSCTVCSSPLDPYGDHQVGCHGNCDLIRRHDSLRDIIFAAAQSSALAPCKEMPSLIPGSCARPTNVFLPQLYGGWPAALDTTVISYLQAATVSDASVIQGSALGVAEARKQALHAAACCQVGVNFYPPAVEALGGWCPSAVSTIRSIGRLLAQRLGHNHADTCRHLFHRLSVALWRGNAAMWVARQPPLPPSVDGLL